MVCKRKSGKRKNKQAILVCADKHAAAIHKACIPKLGSNEIISLTCSQCDGEFSCQSFDDEIKMAYQALVELSKQNRTTYLRIKQVEKNEQEFRMAAEELGIGYLHQHWCDVYMMPLRGKEDSFAQLSLKIRGYSWH